MQNTCFINLRDLEKSEIRQQACQRTGNWKYLKKSPSSITKLQWLILYLILGHREKHDRNNELRSQGSNEVGRRWITVTTNLLVLVNKKVNIFYFCSYWIVLYLNTNNINCAMNYCTVKNKSTLHTPLWFLSQPLFRMSCNTFRRRLTFLL